jgi:hypothetical protein
MMKLLPHQRLRIPNSLAVFAAVLLLVSSVAGFEANQEVQSSGQEVITSVKSGKANTNQVKDTARHKSRSLNLGFLLFRRG